MQIVFTFPGAFTISSVYCASGSSEGSYVAFDGEFALGYIATVPCMNAVYTLPQLTHAHICLDTHWCVTGAMSTLISTTDHVVTAIRSGGTASSAGSKHRVRRAMGQYRCAISNRTNCDLFREGLGDGNAIVPVHVCCHSGRGL